jgi:hypothetical protein
MTISVANILLLRWGDTESENQSTRINPCSSATPPTTNTKWTNVGLNLGLHATNRLSNARPLKRVSVNAVPSDPVFQICEQCEHV